MRYRTIVVDQSDNTTDVPKILKSIKSINRSWTVERELLKFVHEMFKDVPQTAKDVPQGVPTFKKIGVFVCSLM